MAQQTIRAYRIAEPSAGAIFLSQITDINRGTKGTRTISRSPYTSLYLNTAGRGGHIREIHKKHPLRFRVIDRDTVDGKVNSVIVRTPYSDICITYTIARI